MTVRELIEELENLASEFGDETPVRIAHQPSWPFEYSISQVAATAPGENDEEDVVPLIYIAEGQQLRYLPGAAKQELGW